MANHQIKKGCLVRFGWYYRKSPIYDESCEIIGMVLEEPHWRQWVYEKLSQQNGNWCIIEKDENTLVACVYTLTGELEYHPVYNLIRVEEELKHE